MDEAGKENLIKEFAQVTGSNKDRSKFFLESSNWELQTALSTFFDEGNVDTPNVEESSSEDEGQAFYAGGAHSGQQVIGPSKKKRDLVSKIFQSAKEHGAESIEVQDISLKKKKKLHFKGTGYRLGETENDHEAVAGTSSKTEDEPQEVVLKMWSTGYTLDDGPLQSYDEPANKMFLRSVMKGQIPRELMKNVSSGSVFINMEDHKDEDYVASKVSVKAFTGKGHSLGSPTPAVSSNVPVVPPTEDKKPEPINVNSEQPTTQLQIRFPDGSREVLKLNHTHTVGEVRLYIEGSRPHLQNWALMTTFPHAELDNDSLTMAQAQLLNSNIVVKTK